METVADYPLVLQVPGQSIHLGEVGHLPVKSSIKTGNLLQGWIQLLDCLDRSHFLWEMPGRQRNEFFERRQQLGRDPASQGAVLSDVGAGAPTGPVL